MFTKLPIRRFSNPIQDDRKAITGSQLSAGVSAQSIKSLKHLVVWARTVFDHSLSPLSVLSELINTEEKELSR